MPRIPIPRPGPDQVFGLATPLHMLMKLYWEISTFEKALVDSEQSLIGPSKYHAYNCAVTAWHCADWAWNYADDEMKQFMSRAVASNGNSEDGFFDAVCAKSREIYICRQIANGSKHMKLRKPDTSIKVGIEWHYRPNRAKSVLFIFDGSQSVAAELLFRKAAEYWRDLFEALGYCEPQFISGDDD